MKILVIDGQGGKIGSELILRIRDLLPDAEIIAVGSNSIATSAMLRSGADQGATGENPVLVCAPSADVITGPIGIIAANSLLGEITPAMARAVGESPAEKLLLPMNRCNITVVGAEASRPTDRLGEFTEALKRIVAKDRT